MAWAADPRSRLLPKSYFLEYAHRENLRAMRSNNKLLLVLVSLSNTTQSRPVDLYNLSKILVLPLRETDLVGWCSENTIGILLADANESGAKECVNRILEQVSDDAVKCEIQAFPDLEPSISGAGHQDGSVPLRLAARPVRQPSRAAVAIKRGLDIVGSLVGLVLFSPIMLLAAAAIKASSRGPVIFKQIRVGQGGVPFVFYKFRSMRVDAGDDPHRQYVQRFINGAATEVNLGSGDKPIYKLQGDSRVTPIGNWLRKSSIDELPQLVNVLKGEMSLVGPRPPIPYEVEAYRAWHLRRILEVKPGITGLWQVEGRSAVSFDDMVRLDLKYARHWSLLLDVKIILKTVAVVLHCRGSG